MTRAGDCTEQSGGGQGSHRSSPERGRRSGGCRRAVPVRQGDTLQRGRPLHQPRAVPTARPAKEPQPGRGTTCTHPAHGPLRQTGVPATPRPLHPQASPIICHPGWGTRGDLKSSSRAVVSGQGPPLRLSGARNPATPREGLGKPRLRRSWALPWTWAGCPVPAEPGETRSAPRAL